MSRVARVVGSAALVVALCTGAAATLDVWDVIPGFVTLDEPRPDPSPYPTAPGAVVGPAATPVLAAPDPAAPIPTAANVDAVLAGLAADPRVGPRLGAIVVDQLSGEVISSRGADTLMTPASTAKLVTAVASLSVLGADHQFVTSVVQGSSNDRIILVAGGDIMLAAGPGDPAATVGHAGMADLADQVSKALKLTGLTTVTIQVDDSLFSGPAINPQWDPGNVTAGYVAPISPVAVEMARKDTTDDYSARYPDPAANAASVLVARLAEDGITATTTGARATAAKDAVVLGSVTSAPLGDILGYALRHSDNTVTETIARLTAIGAGLPGSFAGATEAVITAVSALGVTMTGAHLSDASGLADGSVLTPRMLADLVQVAASPEHPELRGAVTTLPIAGLTGSLYDRFVGTTARGEVRAKTGSLPGVTSLAGTIVDADGRVLLFAVMADQTGTGGQWGPRAAVDSAVTTIAACGCS